MGEAETPQHTHDAWGQHHEEAVCPGCIEEKAMQDDRTKDRCPHEYSEEIISALEEWLVIKNVAEQPDAPTLSHEALAACRKRLAVALDNWFSAKLKDALGSDGK
jgi:hypothetical protein